MFLSTRKKHIHEILLTFARIKAETLSLIDQARFNCHFLNRFLGGENHLIVCTPSI